MHTPIAVLSRARRLALGIVDTTETVSAGAAGGWLGWSTAEGGSDAAFVALARFMWGRISLCDVIHSPVLQRLQIGEMGGKFKCKELSPMGGSMALATRCSYRPEVLLRAPPP